MKSTILFTIFILILVMCYSFNFKTHKFYHEKTSYRWQYRTNHQSNSKWDTVTSICPCKQTIPLWSGSQAGVVTFQIEIKEDY